MGEILFCQIVNYFMALDLKSVTNTIVVIANVWTCSISAISHKMANGQVQMFCFNKSILHTFYAFLIHNDTINDTNEK